MFKEVGKKIKVIAVILFILELIALVVANILMMIYNNSFVIPGILIIFVGSLVAWIGACFVYGFGELIDKTSEVAHNTHVLGKALRQKDGVAGTARADRNHRQSKEEHGNQTVIVGDYRKEERMKCEEKERRRQAVEFIMHESNEKTE